MNTETPLLHSCIMLLQLKAGWKVSGISWRQCLEPSTPILPPRLPICWSRNKHFGALSAMLEMRHRCGVRGPHSVMLHFEVCLQVVAKWLRQWVRGQSNRATQCTSLLFQTIYQAHSFYLIKFFYSRFCLVDGVHFADLKIFLISCGQIYNGQKTKIFNKT